MVLADDDDDAISWRIVVIEDAEEFIRRDARSASGQALGRLLNLTDGMLGQGLQTLFLLTSNQELRDLHPALVRPGRCLATVEFGPLSPAHSALLSGRPTGQARTLAETLVSESPLLDPHPSTSVGLYL